MVQMPLTQTPSEVFNCCQWHFVLYVEYENCKRPKEIDDYNREFANMADFRR